MTEHYKERCPQLKFECCDARAMKNFEPGIFDAVIDKACFDAILCGDYSGPNSANFLKEIDRVLKDDGIYISITYGVPESRLRHFTPKVGNSYNWGSDLKTMRIAKTTYKKSEVVDAGKAIKMDDGKHFHYVYIMKK